MTTNDLTAAEQDFADPVERPAEPPIDWRPWGWGGLLVLLVVGVYLPTLGNGYIWDDETHILTNPTLRTAEGLSDMWFKWGAIPQYYPLTHTTYWAEFQMWGFDPRGYHMANMLLHAASVVLLWRVLSRLAVPGAWLAAAIFAVHPVCVESVAWISERKNLLSCALALGSMLMYFRYSSPDADAEAARPKEGWDYELSLALFVAALLSKTVVAVLPAVLLVIYWWKRGRVTWRDVIELAPMFLFGATLSYITVWLESSFVGAEGTEWNYSLVQRVLIAGRALWFYGEKLAWPHPLVFFYPRFSVDASAWWQYLFPLGAVAVIVGLWLARNRLGRGPLAAVLIFVLALLPALGFINVYPFRYSLVADHFQYHACIALVALFAAAVTLAVQRLQSGSRWVALVVAIVVLAPLAVVARDKTFVYRDPVSLYTDVLAWNPQSWIAHINLADLLDQQGKTDEARPHFQEGLEHLTKSKWRLGNLGRALKVTGQVDDAIGQLNLDLAGALSDRERAETHRRLGDLYAIAGRVDEAIEQFELSLEVEPDNAVTLGNYGEALADKGDLQGAVERFEESVKLNPYGARVQFRLGTTLRQLGKNDEALVALARSVQFNPNDPKGREELATALLVANDVNSAAREIQQALRLNPRSANAHNLAGMVFAHQGNFDASIAAFEAALEIDPEHKGAAGNARKMREERDKQKMPPQPPTPPGQPSPEQKSQEQEQPPRDQQPNEPPPQAPGEQGPAAKKDETAP